MPRKKIAARIEPIDGISDPNDIRKKGKGKKSDLKLMAAVGGGCSVGDENYPEGSSICYEGHVWTCRGGQWQGPGARC